MSVQPFPGFDLLESATQPDAGYFFTCLMFGRPNAERNLVITLRPYRDPSMAATALDRGNARRVVQQLTLDSGVNAYSRMVDDEWSSLTWRTGNTVVTVAGRNATRDNILTAANAVRGAGA